MSLNILKDKIFLNTLLKLAVPIALQNLISSSLNFVDILMIGRLGETSIAGVGLANQYFFLLCLLLYGITSGASVFTAQYWGNKDIANIKRSLGICIITGMIGSLVFTFIGIVFPYNALRIFSYDSEVINIGGGYLRIVAFSYIVTAITFAYSFILRSIGKVKLPMYISGVAIVTNAFLNYILIFGHFGAPRLGANGAAIATVISRFIEMVLIVSIVYYKKMPIAAKISEMTDLSMAFVKNFFKVTIPVILNESVWALGVTVYAVVYAKMGTQVVAATNISGSIERIMWVIFFGVGSACSVMIGNKIGEGKYDDAHLYAKRFSVLTPILAILSGGILILVIPYILPLFKVSEIVNYYAYMNIVVLSIYMWVKVFNFVCIIGVLRSGGDTKYSLYIDVGSVWLIGVPLAIIGGLVWKLPVYYVYALISLEEIFKFVLGIRRIKSGKWLNNLTANNVNS